MYVKLSQKIFVSGNNYQLHSHSILYSALLSMCISAVRFSHLGSHARVEGILILCRAHLLPPHHLLQTHIIIILEVTHALPIDMSLNLRADGRKRNVETKKVKGNIHWKLDV